jgi:hypothetical protein
MPCNPSATILTNRGTQAGAIIRCAMTEAVKAATLTADCRNSGSYLSQLASPPSFAWPLYQIRQPGDVRRNAPRFVLAEQLRRADRRPGSSSL